MEVPLDVLKARLASAGAAWDTGAPREAVSEALNAVLDFLTTEGAVRHPLRALLGAVGDVYEGRANPLLQPPHRQGGRPPKSLHLSYYEATAAVGVTLLVESGEGLSNACRRAGEAFDIEWKKLRDYRKNLTSGREDAYEADRKEYCSLIQIAHAEKELTPAERAERWLGVGRERTMSPAKV